MSFERAGERSKSKEEESVAQQRLCPAWVIFQNSHKPNGLLVINEEDRIPILAYARDGP